MTCKSFDISAEYIACMSPIETGLALTPEVVARLLDTIFGTRRVAHVQLLSEGLCNFNYRVDFDSGAESVVLRIYGRDANACQKEVDLLRLLREIVPVPEVLHVNAAGFAGVGPFIVLRYVEGITFRQLRRTGDVEAVAQAAHSIGETLAAIGRHQFAQRGTLGAGPAISGEFLNGPNAIPELIDACLASPTLRGRLDERVRERVHKLAWSRAQALAHLQEERRLVHGDFNNRNVLVRREQGRWRVAAVIDWEFAVAGSPLFDIATFLQYERVQNPSREPHFSLGFAQGGGQLPEDWWRLARVVGLVKQCETLAQQNLPADIVTEVAELVRETTEDESI
jgi:aminoglycoside phosphotransferase (APT) family kinase protein